MLVRSKLYTSPGPMFTPDTVLLFSWPPVTELVTSKLVIGSVPKLNSWPWNEYSWPAL